jgi:hypothetical protein
MCQICADAVEKYLSHLTKEEQMDVLWNFTAFPAGDGEYTAKQIQRYARNPKRWIRYNEALETRAHRKFKEDKPCPTR